MPFEITINTTFAAAHAIRLPDGSLEPLHGHNWQTQLTVGCDELDGIETVMDFHDLQAMLDDIVAPVRNRNLNDCPPFADGQGGLAINPTAERVAQWIGESVSAKLPDRVALHAVRIEEAAGCFATWRP